MSLNYNTTIDWLFFERRYTLDYFEKHWDEMSAEDITAFLRQHRKDNNLTESFLREYKDVLIEKDVPLAYELNEQYSTDFFREWKDNDIQFAGEYWNEKTLEEFDNKLNWDVVFNTNYNLSADFIKKHKNKIRSKDVARKIHKDLMYGC